MKYISIIITLVCLSCSGRINENNELIIPKPESFIRTNGSYKIKPELRVYFARGGSESLLPVFSEQVSNYVSLKQSDSTSSDLELRIEAGKRPEGYSLSITRKKIIISASTLNGAFYGLQTLRQLIIFADNENGKRLIPCCTITDSPRYRWRGLMLDESRHFFGPEKVKQMLDIMALHKLNIFHWHLTDVPGWRVEIKQYPALATTGGIGNHTDSKAPAKYYTQEQINDIVKYAAERFIQIVPEIDMPGHAGASNKAYPEFSGGGSKAHPEFTFNPGDEGTYSYLTNILKEVAMMFPSPYIHLGGDEVSFGNQEWNNIPEVKALMKKNDLPDLKAVEKYFVRRMSDSINSMNKITIGWDEITDLNLNPEKAIIMWWRQDKPEQLVKALEENYKVVLCPRIPLYFDFVQYPTHKVGRRWRKSFCDLETVYNFPPDSLTILTRYKDSVLGMQANIWTEVIGDNKRLDYMTYPRLTAMAEAAWTVNENKNYDDFLRRLPLMLNYLKKDNIYYFDPFNPESTPEPAGPEKIN